MILGALFLAIVIIVLVGGLLAILILGLAYVFLGRKLNAQLSSDFKTRPPATLTAPVTITYHCDVTYQKKGRPVTEPLPNAEVTFSVGGDSSVDGSSSVTKSTGADGDASVLLAPVKTGHDELAVHVKAGANSGDEQPIPYEVVKH